MWLKILEISYDKISINKSDFFESKIETGIYYFQKIIPKPKFLKEKEALFIWLNRDTMPQA